MDLNQNEMKKIDILLSKGAIPWLTGGGGGNELSQAKIYYHLQGPSYGGIFCL